VCLLVEALARLPVRQRVLVLGRLSGLTAQARYNVARLLGIVSDAPLHPQHQVSCDEGNRPIKEREREGKREGGKVGCSYLQAQDLGARGTLYVAHRWMQHVHVSPRLP